MSGRTDSSIKFLSVMKIGVVSDTHSKVLPQQMLDEFKAVDFIIHAGDFAAWEDYEIFQNLNDLKAVCGNMDSLAISKRLPRKQIVECGDLRVGIIHGDGPPNKVFERVRDEFKNDNVNAVVFGHSHSPCNQKVGEVLFFNPGSPTDLHFAPYRSYGILEISDGTISGKIIKVEESSG